MRNNQFLMLFMLIFVFFSCVFSQESDSQENITFLSREAAKIAIVADSLEPYFSVLQPMEMSSKKGSKIQGQTIEEQRNECRKRYQEGVREFSDKEKEAIEWHVKKSNRDLS